MAEPKKEARTWSMGTSTTSRSFALESWSYIKHKDYNLHIVKKNKSAGNEKIPATEGQRLEFFRGYCTSPFKLQIIYMQQMQFSGYFWLYLKNLLFKSIPVHYLHVFLAAYSPEEHLFASKMAPLCTGVSWQVIICAILQLVFSMDILSLYLHYNVAGIIFQTPWNKCEKEVIHLKPNTRDIYCFELNKFLNVTSYNKKHNIHDLYMDANFWHGIHPATGGLIFYQAAPMVYFLQQWSKTSVLMYKSYEWIAYFIILWITPALMYRALFRTLTWKTFSTVQLILNIFYLFSALYVVGLTFEEELDHFQRIVFKDDLKLAMGFDFGNLADSVTGPPVVQFLTARSSEQIQPGRDSILIVFSNVFFYMFRSFVNYQIKTLAEAKFQMPVMLSWYNQYPIFFIWNIFFARVEMGAFLLKILYMLLFIVEFLIFTITFHIIIEVVVTEWRVIRRWIASIILPVIGIILSVVLAHEMKRYLYVFTTAISSVAELVVVCWLYPISRLFDDMNFHFGSKPMPLRKLSLALMPFYTIYKLYVQIASFDEVLTEGEQIKRNATGSHGPGVMISILWDHSSARWVWIVPVVPLILGLLFGIIKYIVMQKQSLRELMKPKPDWGPPDHVTRQLRKQFDAREYVGSQASRYLSRHLLAKAQTSTYRLDVKYDTEPDQDPSVVEQEQEPKQKQDQEPKPTPIQDQEQKQKKKKKQEQEQKQEEELKSKPKQKTKPKQEQERELDQEQEQELEQEQKNYQEPKQKTKLKQKLKQELKQEHELEQELERELELERKLEQEQELAQEQDLVQKQDQEPKQKKSMNQKQKQEQEQQQEMAQEQDLEQEQQNALKQEQKQDQYSEQKTKLKQKQELEQEQELDLDQDQEQEQDQEPKLKTKLKREQEQALEQEQKQYLEPKQNTKLKQKQVQEQELGQEQKQSTKLKQEQEMKVDQEQKQDQEPKQETKLKQEQELEHKQELAQKQKQDQEPKQKTKLKQEQEQEQEQDQEQEQELKPKPKSKPKQEQDLGKD